MALTLPHVVRDSERAITRFDAPFAYTTQHDARVLRLQTLAVVRTERQRPPDGGSIVLPSDAADLLLDRSATPTLRLASLVLRLRPRVGHERDPPTA